MEYRKTLDGFALAVLVQPVEIPDVDLGVGAAEDLSSQPKMMLPATPGVEAKVEPITRLPYEKTVPDITADKLEEDMFPSMYYLGEAMKGANM